MNTSQADLWQAVTSFDALNEAWIKVYSNEGSAGGDGVNRREFHADRFARLNQLRADLLSGSYRSRPFRQVSVPKKKPGYRVLTIPAIRDRVLHTSLANALTPIFEPIFEESSFAYRPNKGVSQAVARVERWRDQGYSVVIEADIVKFFDNIDHALLMEKIGEVIAGHAGREAILHLIQQLLEDQAKALRSPGKGLVQGSPLSPLLSNLYLDALDEEIENQGVKLVRFADDFVILCRTEKKAKRVLEHCVAVLGEHGLRLHDDGTRIVNFEKGFDFIGNLFMRSLAIKTAKPPGQPKKPIKSEVTDEGIIELGEDGSRFDQHHRVLYVLDTRHRLTVRNKSYSVRRDDGTELIAIPNRRVTRIEIGPDVDLDNAAVLLSVESNTDVALIDGFGQTKGVILGRISKRAGLHLDHARCVLDLGFRCQIARSLACARIKSQRVQLMRLNRKHDDPKANEAIAGLFRIFKKAETAETVEQAMGFEGAAGAVYWPALGGLSQQQAGTFSRSRPGRDRLNAAINYLTGILERDIRATLHSSGLHTGFAFLHGSRDRHDGLVFDMMEPFRAALSEGLAVFLFNARRLRGEMFCRTEDGCVDISRDGRTALIEGYEAAVGRRINVPGSDKKRDWRGAMLWQCQTLAKAVSGGDAEVFLPYRMEV